MKRNIKVITVLLTRLTGSAPCRTVGALPGFPPICTVTPSHIVSAYLSPASRAECQKRQWGFFKKMLASWEPFSGPPGSSLAAGRLGGAFLWGGNVKKAGVALPGLLTLTCTYSELKKIIYAHTAPVYLNIVFKATTSDKHKITCKQLQCFSQTGRACVYIFSRQSHR